MEKRIWAVGGGKGGTGKSFISTCLGIHLASLGRDAVLIDVDLGAPNLHTILGIQNEQADLGDFLTNKISSLEEVAYETPYDGLRLVRGTENILFVANLNHYKKIRLLRHIKGLSAQDIILDIGTGSSFNSLDFFLTANPGILVVTPEPTAVENTYLFLKSCIMRVLKLYTDHYKMQELYKRIQERMEKNSRSLYGVFEALLSSEKAFEAILYRALRNFRPCLIMNKARDERDNLLGRAISDVVRKYLLIDLHYAGIVPFDARIDTSLLNMEPFLVHHPDSTVGAAVRQIAGELAYSSEYSPRVPEMRASEE